MSPAPPKPGVLPRQHLVLQFAWLEAQVMRFSRALGSATAMALGSGMALAKARDVMLAKQTSARERRTILRDYPWSKARCQDVGDFGNVQEVCFFAQRWAVYLCPPS